ncbi:MAG: cob(I)yrinic acid a,c-diamide adenosyltransferase [Spirochaetaceae bacterium]|jgi:cob(I)alamin adenosyltransferase|nr:cob(I)yrinic acid a,c-diamide adenosyltransferase [Spirochaetaceae bacterium]
MDGLIHVYTGSGKGKTTAAIGLSVRCFGTGKKVVFAQFIKTSKTGELAVFETLGIPVIRSALNLGWTFQMGEDAKRQCRAEQHKLLSQIQDALKDGPDLLVLDEVLDAVSVGMLDDSDLKKLLENKPAKTEIAITGRPVPGWLKEMSSYFSIIEKVKHPFDKGIAARTGIEK